MRYFGTAATVSPAPAAVFTVTSAPAGGWPNLGGAPFYYNGYSYIGYASNAGGIFVAIFNHTTGAITTSTLAADGSTTNDQHNKPGLLRRTSDNKLVAAYCDHDASTMYVRVTTNALSSDPTISGGWATPTNIDSQLGSTKYTYPALFEFGTDIMLFYRDNDGLSNWEIATHVVDTTDLATGWSAFTNLVYGTRAYALACQPSSTRLDFFVTDGSYAEDYASLYHFYRSGSSYYTSAGVAIGGSPPFAFSSLTKVYNGVTANAGARVPADCLNDGSNIAVVFPVQTGIASGHIGQDENYLYCKAAVGSASWSNKTVATAVGALTFEFTEGSLAIDTANINHLIVSKRSSSSTSFPFHIYDYLTADAGDSWTVTPISVTGDADMYPWYVRGYQSQLRYVWLKGTFTSQSVFNTGIQGFGVPV